MICLISGTNREDSYTYSISNYIYATLQENGFEDVKLLDMRDLNENMTIHAPMYIKNHQSEVIKRIQDEYIIPADKFIFVVPEYNGSIPGLLKLFIDAISVRKYTENFHGKKALLVGVSTGRAGNLRGLDHLTGILQYLEVFVFPHKVPLSKISEIYDKSEMIFSENEIEENLNNQLTKYMSI